MLLCRNVSLFPFRLLYSSEEKRTGEVIDAQASVTAKCLSHLFDSAIWWHAQMQHGAVDKTPGATVGEAQELYGVDEVVAGKLLFRCSVGIPEKGLT